MIRNMILFIFSLNILFAANLDDFDTRQAILQDIKKVIQKEESIARAYEQYILDKYDNPSNIADLLNIDYLGTSADFTKSIKDFASKFETFSIELLQISYALKDDLKDDSGIKSLYESNTFRKRTYYVENKIHFILENSFAKHLFNLIYEEKRALEDCSIGTDGVSCILNNHIYIKPKYNGTEMTEYLMAYHIDNFKIGPIVITEDESQHSDTKFESIPKGALLIDKTGKKYVKTTRTPPNITGIEELK